MVEIDIDECKGRGKKSVLRYSLGDARVFESENGFHFTDYLDHLNEHNRAGNSPVLTDDVREYIQYSLQSNSQRFSRHVALARRFVDVSNARCLDVGCGGGLFLSRLKSLGSEVHGVDPNVPRVQYAREQYDIEVSTKPIESNYWQHEYSDAFDLVTLWDVIEHVNLPFQTLCAAYNLVRSGDIFNRRNEKHDCLGRV
jgi:2-polyprenyl-6-hydroxyphenyl methylase/3-demethylubiquinone-9 3-methyltransferase